MGMNLRYSPLEWDDKTKSFDFGGGTIDNASITALLSTIGDVFYVSSVTTDKGLDAEGNQGKTKDAPLRTLEYAIGRCKANNGDVIALMPGYTDTVASAGDKAVAKAGITIVGLGHGADRPNLTWSATDSSFDITGASTRILNIIGTAGIDSIVEAFNVQAADCEFDIEWRDGSAAVEAITIFLCNASADNLKINLDYQGFTAGNACDSPISLNGSVGAEINVNFYGVAATSVVEFITAAVEDVNVTGYFYNSGTTDLSKNVVDTVTGSTWFVQGYDGAAGSEFSGGSGQAIAAGDLSTIAANVAATLVDTSTTLPATLAAQDALAPATATTGTVALTGGSVTGIFTIAGGPILIEALIGHLTEAVSANACAAKLVANPTAGADTDMCATVDINAMVINSFLTIDGTIANAMVNAVPATALPLGIGMDVPLCVPVGTIDLNLANSDPTTGTVVWYLRYRPLTTGVTVTAVA